MNVKLFFEYIKEECYKYGFLKGTITILFVRGGINAVFLIRLLQLVNYYKLIVFQILIKNALITRYGIFIGNKTVIGKGLVLPHPSCIVFGQETYIGKNATIFQNTTLGSKDVGVDEPFYPHIGDNCIICAGAMILSGKEKLYVGDNSIIAANAVLFKNAEENSICYGTPANTKTRIQTSI